MILLEIDLISSDTASLLIRSISVAKEAVVLGLTLWRTFYIFKLDREARAGNKLTTTLAQNGEKNKNLLPKHCLLRKFAQALFNLRKISISNFQLGIENPDKTQSSSLYKRSNDHT